MSEHAVPRMPEPKPVTPDANPFKGTLMERIREMEKEGTWTRT
jgi:hypothetical protein